MKSYKVMKSDEKSIYLTDYTIEKKNIRLIVLSEHVTSIIYTLL